MTDPTNLSLAELTAPLTQAERDLLSKKTLACYDKLPNAAIQAQWATRYRIMNSSPEALQRLGIPDDAQDQSRTVQIGLGWYNTYREGMAIGFFLAQKAAREASFLPMPTLGQVQTQAPTAVVSAQPAAPAAPKRPSVDLSRMTGLVTADGAVWLPLDENTLVAEMQAVSRAKASTHSDMLSEFGNVCLIREQVNGDWLGVYVVRESNDPNAKERNALIANPVSRHSAIGDARISALRWCKQRGIQPRRESHLLNTRPPTNGQQSQLRRFNVNAATSFEASYALTICNEDRLRVLIAEALAPKAPITKLAL